MTVIEAVLAIALALPGPWYRPGDEPESPRQRAVRVEAIVKATDLEARAAAATWPGDTRSLAIAALATTYEESRRWALEVHDGRVRGDDGRSVCLGQIHGGGDELVGTSLEATRRCMRAVVDVLTYHARRCRVRTVSEWTMAMVFSGYGSGYSCDASASWARERARLWARMISDR